MSDGLPAAEQTYCAYCNAVYRIDDDIALIQAHIYECPEHPLPKALARAEAAEARVAELERFEALEAELNRARAKFPGHDHLLAALVEEVGETAQAYLKGRPSDARAEALQVACVAMRIVEEGDLEFERADYVSTEPAAPTTEAVTE